ncbi:hypothetical protein P2G74_01350 [Cronobacter muytjensii]|uniref:hypothetical protein n=1 Tax=Cronobacter muytjensii TaxID=413501 RepID=UPI002DBB8C16|nr:hypothetical protein [Cronobacter muytjensii]MEB8638619.1 hypothetical protein [Cronobacter muytjensii]
MAEYKIIAVNDAELAVLVSALEAMWAAGATRVTLEKQAPTTVEMTVITGDREGKENAQQH